MGLSYSYFALSMVLLDLGDVEGAQVHAKKALDLAQKGNEKYFEGWGLTILGRILGKKESPQTDEAEKYILRGIKILDELKIKPSLSVGYLCLAELYAAKGRRLKALTNLKRAQRMFKAMGMEYYLALSKQASQD
jgi:tetratricopeptide (TPR) repeat protein